MKRLSILIVLAFALTACSWGGIQIKPPDVEDIITGAGPRMIGFFVGKNNPDRADKIIEYCDLLAGSDEPIDFKAKLDEGVDWLLNKYLDEPYIIMEIENALPEFELDIDVPTSPWMEKAKVLIKNFRTGIKFGAGSVTSSDKGFIFGKDDLVLVPNTASSDKSFIQRYLDVYETAYLYHFPSRGLP